MWGSLERKKLDPKRLNTACDQRTCHKHRGGREHETPGWSREVHTSIVSVECTLRVRQIVHLRELFFFPLQPQAQLQWQEKLFCSYCAQVCCVFFCELWLLSHCFRERQCQRKSSLFCDFFVMHCWNNCLSDQFRGLAECR